MSTITRSCTDINGHDDHAPEQQHEQLQQTIIPFFMKPIHPSIIEEDEQRVRSNTSATYVHGKSFQYQSIYWLFVNTYASICIFVLHLISYETIFSISLSVGLTLYLYYSIIQDNNNNSSDNGENVGFNGNTMNWVLLTFAVITPIGATIQMVFTRRENALLQLSTLRSTMIQLYNAYAIWGWDYHPYSNNNNNNSTNCCSVNGRTKSNIDWLEHSDLALREILFICDDLTRYVRGMSHHACVCPFVRKKYSYSMVPSFLYSLGL